MSGKTKIWVLILSCLFLVTVSSVWGQDQTKALETKKDKESYSIGYQVGLSMKGDGVDVDLDKFVQGMRDAVDGKDPLLTGEEMKTLIVDLRKKAEEAQMRKSQEMIVNNAKEAKEFLEENAKKEGVRVTGSGLQYTVLKEGDGASPGLEDSVTVHYRGMFTDGKEFDSSYTRNEPQTFQVEGVIKGWTEGLQMMMTGSKWKFFVPPDLAYGRRGMGAAIPPNKVLVFEVELLSIEKGVE